MGWSGPRRRSFRRIRFAGYAVPAPFFDRLHTGRGTARRHDPDAGRIVSSHPPAPRTARSGMMPAWMKVRFIEPAPTAARLLLIALGIFTTSFGGGSGGTMLLAL